MTASDLAHLCNKAHQRADGGWQVCCPAHDDHNPSLSLTDDTDKTLVYCHAGCTPDAIMTKLGLAVADLFPPRASPAPRPQTRGYRPDSEIAATYDYVDPHGTLVHQTVRYDAPKEFKQRRPHPTRPGAWLWNLQGIEPVLYRLPQLLEGMQAGRIVFLCEGEKDADNLRALGLVATTNPMGAGKWRRSYTETLRGALVVLLPDNDESGRKHVQVVMKGLQNSATSVKVIELPGLPDKGDVSDWLASGGDRAQLEALVAAAPLWTPHAPAPEDATQGAPDGPRAVLTNLGGLSPEAVRWLWEPFLPAGKLTLLAGDPGGGKTWLALQIAAIVSRGFAFPDRNGHVGAPSGLPATVLYMTAEDGLADTIAPRLDAMGADRTQITALEGHRGALGQILPVSLQDLDVLDEALRTVRPALLVVDPIQAFLGPKVDMHRANEVRPLLAGLGRLAEQYGCACLLIMHLSKATQSRALYRALGSIDFTAAARSVLLVGADPEAKDTRLLAQAKSSLAPQGPTLKFVLDAGQFLWAGVSDLGVEDVAGRKPAQSEHVTARAYATTEAYEWLREQLQDGPRLAEEIQFAASARNIAEATLKRAKKRLYVLTRRKGEKWLWSLPRDRDNEHTVDPVDPLDLVDPLDPVDLLPRFQGITSFVTEEGLQVPTEQGDQGDQEDQQDQHVHVDPLAALNPDEPLTFESLTATELLCATCQRAQPVRTVLSDDGSEIYHCGQCDREVGTRTAGRADRAGHGQTEPQPGADDRELERF